ncbi:MAG: sporulation integral membrane protein YtvI [Clostridia bacterium]|nr:sporulation integral membrane protein YtvI [Clostridia bacterium]
MEAKKSFIVNIIFYGIVIAIALLVGKYILPILTPFIIAFAVASLFNWLTGMMHFKRESLRRLVAILFCSILYALVFIGVLIAGSKLINQAGSILTSIPSTFSNQIMPFLDTMATRLETAVTPYDTQLASYIDSLTSSVVGNLGKFVTDFSKTAVVFVTNCATSIPGLIVQIVITVISTFFVLLDYEKICKFLLKLIPASKRELFSTSLHYTKTMISVYIKSYSLLFLLTFVELSIGFLILGVKNAVLIAVTISIFDLMPILGTGGIVLPWALLALLVGNWVRAVGLLVLYLVITGIRQTLEPKIVGKQIGLHPLATLVSMLVGLKLFGVVGLFALPVCVAVTTAMYRTKRKREGNEATVA